MDNHQRERILIHKLASKAGFRGKVDAKCVDCIYDVKQPGTWRQQVDQCNDTSCPLFPIRPRSQSEKPT